MGNTYGEEIRWKFTLNIKGNSIKKFMFRKEHYYNIMKLFILYDFFITKSNMQALSEK